VSAFGLLEQFSGTLVHDHWSAYDRHTGAHGLCNVHHVRELIGLEEAFPNQGWASRMIEFLCARPRQRPTRHAPRASPHGPRAS
jgi:transposase